LFSGRIGRSLLCFHLAFSTGIGLGTLEAVGLIPHEWAIGAGKHGVLLGVNLYRLLLCTAAFFLPLAVPRYRLGRAEGMS